MNVSGVCVCVPCSTPTHYPMWFFFFADSSSSLTGQELAGLRVILGVFEAGYFPGAVYLLSTWFVRYDVGKRYAVFYMIGSLASAVSGILVSFEKKENMNKKRKNSKYCCVAQDAELASAGLRFDANGWNSWVSWMEMVSTPPSPPPRSASIGRPPLNRGMLIYILQDLHHRRNSHRRDWNHRLHLSRPFSRPERLAILELSLGARSAIHHGHGRSRSR